MKYPLYDTNNYNRNMVTWFVVSTLLLTGYVLLKDIIVFMLAKLYEFFIQQNLFMP